MKDGLVKIGLICGIILFIGVSVVPIAIGTNGNTIYVDDDADPGWYDATHVKTIQEGIDNASAGYTIFVYNGTYNELSLEIDKTLHLIGEDKDTTIINCTDVTGYAVWIQVNDTTVSNFTITGQEYGIDLERECRCWSIPFV